jgi:hypothetical protein
MSGPPPRQRTEHRLARLVGSLRTSSGGQADLGRASIWQVESADGAEPVGNAPDQALPEMALCGVSAPASSINIPVLAHKLSSAGADDGFGYSPDS